MAKGLINKYVWLIDTIMRHKRITRKEINELWMRNESISDGNPLPRRTFYNYCREIESTFDITISCSQSTFEYYIEDESDNHGKTITDWLLDSMAINGTLSNSRDIASRIMLENVPSARLYLPTIMNSMKENRRIDFKYQAFGRSGSTLVTLEPYFVRIFKQRWYVIGREPAKKIIRTYALDRFTDIQVSTISFEPPEIDASEFFKNSFGIYQNDNQPETIKLKVDYDQAKYLRALPLHHTQSEEVHDKYSIFYYQMLPTYDLIEEILSHGSKIEVLEPQTLRVKVINALTEALNKYKPEK